MTTTTDICILGIDPGSRVTGYGVIRRRDRQWRYVDSGVVKTANGEFNARLRTIHAAAGELFAQFSPDELAIESVFVNVNAASALKLGAARSAVLCASFAFGTRIHEYAPRAVKQAVTGRGSADKAQVQQMVKMLLRDAPRDLTHDASDALAIALCHGHSRDTQAAVARVRA